MDISRSLNRLRKVVATFSVATLVASLLVVAPVQAAFPSNFSWAEDAANALSDPEFHTSEALGEDVTKCVFSQILMNALELDAAPEMAEGFNDVPEWAMDAVGAMVANGIAEGRDPEAGVFGCADAMSRAEAIVMSANAFNLCELEGSEGSVDEDEFEGVEWAMEGFSCAYNLGVVSQYRLGESMNKAEGLKTVYVSMDPEARGGDPVEPPATDVDASVSANFADGGTLPLGAQAVTFVAFELDVDTATTLDSLVFERSGVSQASDFNDFYLYQGSVRINNSGREINSSSNEVAFNNLDVDVDGSMDFSLVGSVDTAADAGNDVVMELVEVGLEGDSVTVGGLPVEGPEFEIGGVQVGTFELNSIGSLDDVAIGSQGSDLAEFEFDNIDNEDILVERVVVENEGTADTDGLFNLGLEVDGELVAEGVVFGDLVGFEFDTAVYLDEGAQERFTVTGDVSLEVDSGDTILFEVDNSSDIRAIGQDFGFGARATSTFPVQFQTVTVEAGDVTFAFNNTPVTGDIAIGASDVSLMDFNVTTETEVFVDTLPVIFTSTADGDLDEAGEQKLQDLKIVNRATGQILAGPEEYAAAAGAAETVDFDEGFFLSPGEVHELAVTVDVDEDDADGDSFQVTLELSGDLAIEDENGDDVDDVVPGTDIDGNVMTTLDEVLTVNETSTPVAQDYVSGQDDVALGGFSFAANEASDVLITDITVTGAVALGDGGGEGPREVVERAALYNSAGERVSDFESFTTGDEAIFEDLEISVEAGKTVRLVVRGDISSSAPYDTGVGGDDVDELTLSIAAEADVTAETAEDGDDVTIEDGDGGAFSAEAANVMSINAAGSITSAEGPDNPLDDLVLGGTSGVEMLEVQFDAVDEPWVVRDMQVEVSDPDEVVSVTATYENEAGETVTSEAAVSGGVAQFTDEEVYVEADNFASVMFTADLNSVDDGAESGTAIELTFDADDSFEAVGQGSGTSETDATNDVVGGERVLVNSYPTITVASSDSTLSNTTKSFTFTVGAEGEAVTMGELTVTTDISDADAGGELELGTFKLVRNGTDITERVAIATDNTLGTTLENTNTLGDGDTVVFIDFSSNLERISGGSSNTYALQFTVAGTEADDSVSFYLNEDATQPDDVAAFDSLADIDDDDDYPYNFLWSDNSDSPSGLTSSDFTSGYQVESMPSNTQSWTKE